MLPFQTFKRDIIITTFHFHLILGKENVVMESPAWDLECQFLVDWSTYFFSPNLRKSQMKDLG